MYLVCPACQSSLTLTAAKYATSDRIESGSLDCPGCERRYPVERGVPRFVPAENYASGFGLQWIKHARTQYDSETKRPITATRFFAQTKWPRDMSGQLVLEVGSGSGRFTEVIAATGAMVVSFDYSVAVEANDASNGQRENVLIVQADIFQMPFRRGTFDRVCCLGVLQHTPDPPRAFAALPPMIKPGGSLAVDVYRKPRGIERLTTTKYLVRPLTRRIPPGTLYPMVERYVTTLWSVIRFLPRRMTWKLLIADYRGVLDLPNETLRNWAVLDTFDMLNPAYDTPQDLETVRQWCAQAGLVDHEANYGYNGIEARGRVPDGAAAPAAVGAV
jgi:SAM-dependent methyltransferase